MYSHTAHNLKRALTHMKAISYDVVFLSQRLRQRIRLRFYLHLPEERGVERQDLLVARFVTLELVHRLVDEVQPFDGWRVVQGVEGGGIVQELPALVIDDCRLPQLVATLHDPMRYDTDVLQVDVFVVLENLLGRGFRVFQLD